MAKKNKKQNEIKIGDGSVIAIITENLSKKGEIKGRNKRQTKVLRGACMHHVINRKGKVKARIWNDGKGHCTCTLCKFTFGTKRAGDKELDLTVGDFQKLNNQAKFIAAAIGADSDTITYLSKIGSDLMFYNKTYKRIMSIVEKRDNLSNKKQKSHTGSNNFGSWG